MGVFDAKTAPNGASAPTEDFELITPDDDNDLAETARGFYSATGGNIHVTTAKGNDRTIPVGPYQIIPTAIKRVFDTGTTAEDIVVLTR